MLLHQEKACTFTNLPTRVRWYRSGEMWRKTQSSGRNLLQHRFSASCDATRKEMLHVWILECPPHAGL
jgi:hypothetical protein